jgi:hypothetical protein
MGACGFLFISYLVHMDTITHLRTKVKLAAGHVRLPTYPFDRNLPVGSQSTTETHLKGLKRQKRNNSSHLKKARGFR